MVKAEAGNSYLDLDYSGLKKKSVIVNNFMKFYKNCLKKNNQNILYKIVLYDDNILLHCYL